MQNENDSYDILRADGEGMIDRTEASEDVASKRTLKRRLRHYVGKCANGAVELLYIDLPKLDANDPIRDKFPTIVGPFHTKGFAREYLGNPGGGVRLRASKRMVQ